MFARSLPVLLLLSACRAPFDPKSEDPGSDLEPEPDTGVIDSGGTDVPDDTGPTDSAPDTADSGVDTSNPDTDAPPPEQRLFVTYADWSARTGALSVYDWPSAALLAGPIALDGADNRMDCDAGAPFLLSRNTGVDDVARLLSADDGSTLASWSFGPDAEPWDVAAAGGGYWVALRSGARIDVFDAGGVPDGSIDLTPYADADGTAEPASIRTLDGVTYVLLGGHDEDDPDEPFGTPQLLAFDAASRALLWQLPLSGRVSNVVGQVEDGLLYQQAAGLLTRTDTGGFERQLVGGIEVVDLTARTTSGLLLTEAALGATIDFFSVRAGTGTAWIVTTDATTGVQSVGVVDLSNWDITTRFVPEGAAVRVLFPQDDGTFWVVESTTLDEGTSEGAYVHRDADFTELGRLGLGPDLTGVTTCGG